jgi:bifunctional DNA-binding transcriptional regulator/antitoxin component of YhaV-PrlF toxin-antitoxin module
MKTVLDDAGRIQLPQDVQARMGVRPGDEVVLEERAGEWVLRSANAPAGLSWEGNVLVHRGTSRTGAAVEELLGEVRDERLRGLAEGLDG